MFKASRENHWLSFKSPCDSQFVCHLLAEATIEKSRNLHYRPLGFLRAHSSFKSARCCHRLLATCCPRAFSPCSRFLTRQVIYLSRNYQKYLRINYEPATSRLQALVSIGFKSIQNGFFLYLESWSSWLKKWAKKKAKNAPHCIRSLVVHCFV